MKIAIVGASRLTPDEDRDAHQFCGMHMNRWKAEYGDDLVIVSGGAKGVDTIAEECAKQLDIKTLIIKPDVEQWDDNAFLIGYKTRNENIVIECDKLWCLPASYRNTLCYHCNSKDHERCGGCWTAKRAKFFKREVHIIPPTR